MNWTQRTGRKVPEITAYFWIVKILTTAMGEAISDFSVHRIDPVIAVVFGAMGLAVALSVQLLVRRYIAWVYWLAVVMVAIFGTMAADVIHVRFGVPYVASAAGFSVALILVFLAWYRTEGTLSIHSIDTPRRELFYWATVLATFALGTAAGDMTAYTFHRGFFVSGLIFTAVIAIPALAYRFVGLNEVTAFWFAYIVTRPLGASFADWMGTPRSIGGLDLGRGNVSIVLTVLIVGFVAYLQISRVDLTTPKHALPVRGLTGDSLVRAERAHRDLGAQVGEQ
jgi:uncharacterized membrane-anchored protein